jgi:hypothetical protein
VEQFKGKLQTYQWGKPKGSYTQIYNKTAAMQARGLAVSGPQITHFERRLKQPACKSHTKLAELDDPFAGFVLTTTVPEAPDDGPAYVWPLFCDSQRSGTARGVAVAPRRQAPCTRSSSPKRPRNGGTLTRSGRNGRR